LTGFQTHTLTPDEIGDIVQAFAKAAGRGKTAGFDAILIHGGHGYLIHEFLSPRTNRRTDEYGGNVEKRARFPAEIIREIRKEVGPDFPIMIRMNGDDFLEGGIRIEEAIQHAQIFEEAGSNALDVSSGPFETHQWQFPLHCTGTLVLRRGKKSQDSGDCLALTLFMVSVFQKARYFIEMGRALMATSLQQGQEEDWMRSGTVSSVTARKRTSSYQPVLSILPRDGNGIQSRAALPRRRSWYRRGGRLEAACTPAERGHELPYEKGDQLGRPMENWPTTGLKPIG
jgi:hypothetical protein